MAINIKYNIEVAWTATSPPAMQREWRNLWPDIFLLIKFLKLMPLQIAHRKLVGLCKQARLDSTSDVKDITAHQLYEQSIEIKRSGLDSSIAETSDVITEKKKTAKMLNAAQYFKQVVRIYDDSEDFRIHVVL